MAVRLVADMAALLEVGTVVLQVAGTAVLKAGMEVSMDSRAGMEAEGDMEALRAAAMEVLLVANMEVLPVADMVVLLKVGREVSRHANQRRSAVDLIFQVMEAILKAKVRICPVS